MPNVLPRLIILLFIFESCVFLTWQACLSSYKYYADSRNPYVYAHPTTEVFTMVERIEDVARVHPAGYGMHIQVICPGHDYWPLPWYLRSFEEGAIEWWDKVVDDKVSAPLIIASDQVEAALTNKLYALTPLQERQMYLYLFDEPYYMWLRPKVKLLGFVRKDLWDLYRQSPDPEELIRKSSKK